MRDIGVGVGIKAIALVDPFCLDGNRVTPDKAGVRNGLFPRYEDRHFDRRSDDGKLSAQFV